MAGQDGSSWHIWQFPDCWSCRVNMVHYRTVMWVLHKIYISRLPSIPSRASLASTLAGYTCRTCIVHSVQFLCLVGCQRNSCIAANSSLNQTQTLIAERIYLMNAKECAYMLLQTRGRQLRYKSQQQYQLPHLKCHCSA